MRRPKTAVSASVAAALAAPMVKSDSGLILPESAVPEPQIKPSAIRLPIGSDIKLGDGRWMRYRVLHDTRPDGVLIEIPTWISQSGLSAQAIVVTDPLLHEASLTMRLMYKERLPSISDIQLVSEMFFAPLGCWSFFAAERIGKDHPEYVLMRNVIEMWERPHIRKSLMLQLAAERIAQEGQPKDGIQPTG